MSSKAVEPETAPATSTSTAGPGLSPGPHHETAIQSIFERREKARRTPLRPPMGTGSRSRSSATASREARSTGRAIHIRG